MSIPTQSKPYVYIYASFLDASRNHTRSRRLSYQFHLIPPLELQCFTLMQQALSISRHGVDLDPWFIIIYSLWEIILLLRWRRIAASILSCRQVRMENRRPISFNTPGLVLHCRPSCWSKDHAPRHHRYTSRCRAAFSQTKPVCWCYLLYCTQASSSVACNSENKQRPGSDVWCQSCLLSWWPSSQKKSNWYQLALLVSRTSKSSTFVREWPKDNRLIWRVQ